MRLYLCTKFQVSIIILRSFRHGPPQDKSLKSPSRLEVRLSLSEKVPKLAV